MNLLKNETILETERLIIRNWHGDDLDLFYEINSHDDVMEFFPFRRNRRECEELLQKFHNDIAEKSYGWFALATKQDNQAIGFCGLADVPDTLSFAPAIEIGWRLAKPYWSKGYVTEAACSIVEYAFTTLDQPIITAFAVHDNHRSTAVMKRIGMQAVPEKDFDHPNVREDCPHLNPHVYYEITREHWLMNIKG
jgi:RimJ/RimL family protein N-acetyltransferase